MTDAPKKPLVEAASRLLADSYTLYLKTHNYHWNVTGPMFGTLHALFETEYTELALAVDEIAERIRTLGAPAPGSYAAFSRLATIKDAPDSVPSAEEMIHQLASDQDAVVASASKLLQAAEAAGDAATADLATRRIEVHEKNAWMLRAHLG
jgi:starvation-inducible DNA-binding protein